MVGYDTAIGLAIEEVPTSAAGERFVYSDINYILLGEIVRRVSGQPLNEFAREHIFEPLGMTDTMFLPGGLVETENRSDREMHAVRMAVRRGRTCRCSAASCTIRPRGGWEAWPGTPGCFRHAADVSIFCQMILNGARTRARASSRRSRWTR